MNVLEIPLIKLLGIRKNKEGMLELPFLEETASYFQTQHAGTQFTLAETASVDFIQSEFSHLEGKVDLVFRKSETKFRQMSQENIIAFASINQENKNKFEKHLKRRGQANIAIDVKLIDIQNIVTLEGVFYWFLSIRKC